MEYSVLCNALREFTTGLLNQLLVNLSGRDGQTWLDEFKKFLRKEPCWVTTAVTRAVGAIVTYVVDCTLSLQEMIRDCSFDSVSNDITAERFPVRGAGSEEWEFKVFHFNRDICSEDAVLGIKDADKANPWKPAGIEHLLTYGKNHREEQRKYPIVALGSGGWVGGSRRVPYLRGGASSRILRLGYWVVVWYSNFRFLAVRKTVRIPGS